MESWNRLVSVATVGGARAGQPEPLPGRANADPAEPQSIGDLLRLAGQGSVEVPDLPARRVLRQAAILTVARRAGYVPVRVDGALFSPYRPVNSSAHLRDGDAAPRSADRDNGRECSSAATARLAMILTDRLHLLPEWLRLIGEAGCRPPDVLLPELLDLADRQPEIARALVKVLGSRGEWLAGLNPRWAALPDSSRHRRSPSTGVQPGSDLSRLLITLVRYDRHPLGRDSISLRHPAEGDESRVRDFLRDLPAPVDGGETEVFAPPDTLLGELLTQIDPAFWIANWQVGPESIVSAVARSESRELLLQALTIAVSRFEAPGWAEPILAERLREPNEEGIGIFRLLPADRQEHWIRATLRQCRSLEADQPAFWLLIRSTAPWGRPVARLLFPLLRREVSHRAAGVLWDWQRLMRQAALSLDPRLATELADLFAPDLGAGTGLIPELSRLIDDLAFRAAMTREIGRRTPN